MSKASDFLRGALDLPLLPINAYKEYKTQANTTDIYPIDRGEMRVRRHPDYLSLTGRKPDEHIEINRTITPQPLVKAKINSDRWNKKPVIKRPSVAMSNASTYGKDPKMGLSNFRRADKPRSLDNL